VSSTLGQHSAATAEVVVSRLTDLRPKITSTLHYAVESAAADRPGQLVVAVLGRLDGEDAGALLRLQRNRAQGLALVLDVDTFADQPASPRRQAERELAVRILREHQWRVVEVPRGMGVADAWAALESTTVGV
jgi:hypothetical protein